MTTTARKDAYGRMIETVLHSPEMRTAVQAGKDTGMGTRKFGFVARRLSVSPLVVTGTERNQFPTWVYTPDQVAEIAASSHRYNGNGKPIE